MIGIDIRFLRRDMEDGIISSGVGLFFAEVLSGMKESDRRKTALIIRPEQREAAETLFPGCLVLECGERDPQNNACLPERFLRENGIRCLWFPFATPHYYVRAEIPVIATIHDLIMIHEDPSNTKRRDGFRKILEESREVIVISDHVRRDILREFEGADIKNIQVIPCPVAVDTEAAEEVRELKGKDFILDVNAYQKRKNGITLLKAYALSGLKSGCDLVFCGGNSEKNTLEELQKTAAELGLEGKVHFYFAIPIEQRNWLLKHARMLVSPSLSEGFGRTPVEAAISGIPVITSTADSLEEVTLGLLKYVREPTNAKEMAEAIREVYAHPPGPEERQRIAGLLKEKYAPARIADAYRKVFAKYNTD